MKCPRCNRNFKTQKGLERHFKEMQRIAENWIHEIQNKLSLFKEKLREIK